MRQTWQRTNAELSLAPGEIAALVGRLLPDARLREVAALQGGMANTNIRLAFHGAPHTAVLRIWQRNPQAAAIELAVLARVAGSVAVPAILATAADDPALGRPCALLGWIDGERLGDIADGLPEAGLAELGVALGATLAAIHRFEFAGHGFLDAGLLIATPIQPGGAGLSAWLRRCLEHDPGEARLGRRETAALLAHVDRHGHRLDQAWAARPCLTHADFNPSNILVRQHGGSWQVAGVLDWEFAFAGGPTFDLAHVLRPSLGDHVALTAALAHSYRGLGHALPSDWQDIARLADLFAWADFLARPAADAAVVGSARAMIARIMGAATPAPESAQT